MPDDTTHGILLVSDISGYTEFVYRHARSASHARQITARLLKAIVAASGPPLSVAELEGDAVFFSALGSAGELPQLAEQVKHQIPQLFRAFAREMKLLESLSKCSCQACSHIGGLSLKQVVHAGEVAVERIGRFEKLFGLAVIIVHRMLKNSVQASEYLMLSGPAFSSFGGFFGLEPERLVMRFEGIGEHEMMVFHAGQLASVLDERQDVDGPIPAPALSQVLRWSLGMGVRTLLDVVISVARRGRDTLRHAMPFVVLASSLALASCTAKQVQYAPLTSLPPDPRPVEASLFLVGDAGQPNAMRDAVLMHLSDEVEAAAAGGTSVVVAYLGDNIYEVGAREAFLEQDLLKLGAQIEPLGTRDNVRGVFVPGNHDWANGAPTTEGRAAVQIQREWLERLGNGRDVALLPDDGCPGPATLDVGASLHLVFVDTEWLLRKTPDRCGTAAEFYERLSADLEGHRGSRIVVMAHHPMVTGGPHGGHLAPFYRGPGVFYLATKAGVSVQDVASGAYSDMVRRFAAAFDQSDNPPLVFAAGHDHNLQVIGMDGPGRPAYQLVSGSGSKTSNARRIDGTRYATNSNGYMRLDFRSSDVRLVVYAQVVAGGPVRPVFSCDLTSASTGDPSCPEAPLLQSTGR